VDRRGRIEASVDVARYVVAVMMLVSVPISLSLWYFIHPFAHGWRRLGPVWTYAILAVPSLAIGLGLFRFRQSLLGRDLGTNPLVIALTVPAAVAGILVARARRRHLTQKILVGVPELSSTDASRLLTEGIYARVRNPRYLEFLLFVLVYVGFANYAGTWVLYALCFPAIHLVVVLEERELLDRFGEKYEAYRRRVPRYLPRRRPS
jgi:protein-S-isoprenylcysteine O-methyltransferase Ste14